MNKRIKFILTSIVLSLGFIGINFLEEDLRFVAIGALSALTFILFFISLKEGLRKDATLLTLILPTMFTLGVGFFWFLLPTSLIARIPVVIFYGIGLYALALTANIFSVSTIRTIALSRAARGVGFVLTLLTCFFLFDAILSLRAPIYVVAGLIFSTSALLFLQGLWMSLLDRKVSKKIINYTLLLSISVTQVAIMLFFWPVSVVVGSLFLTVGIYLLLGLGQANLEERLFKRTLREYVSVGVVVFIAVFFATHWGG